MDERNPHTARLDPYPLTYAWCMQRVWLNQSGDTEESSRVAFQFVSGHTDDILAYLRVSGGGRDLACQRLTFLLHHVTLTQS